MDQRDPLHSFENLPPAVETRLRKNSRTFRYQAGDTIFFQGDDPNAIYLVAEGRVKIQRVTPEGYESILCVRGPGEYFCPVPLLDNGEQLGAAVAMNEVILLRLGQEEFSDLCADSPEFLNIVQADCLSEVRHLLNRLEGFAFRGIRQRLAIAFVREIRKQRDAGVNSYEIKMTQQELAALVGASRESVSRNLAKMERAGVIQTGRGRVAILDWKKMEIISGEKG